MKKPGIVAPGAALCGAGPWVPLLVLPAESPGEEESSHAHCGSGSALHVGYKPLEYL